MRNFIVFFLLFLPFSLSAQLFDANLILGFSGGQIDGDTQAGYKKLGLTTGLELTTTFKKAVNFQIEARYSGKGAVKSIKLNDGSSYREFKTDLHYLELPILLHYQTVSAFNFSLGIAPSYLLKSKLYNFDSEISETLYEMNPFVTNGIFQVSYRISDKLSLNTEFSYSLYSIRKDKCWHTNTLTFSILYKISQARL